MENRLFEFPFKRLSGGKRNDSVYDCRHGPLFLDNFDLLCCTWESVEVGAESRDEVREFVESACAFEFLYQERDGDGGAIDPGGSARAFLFALLVRGGVGAEEELGVSAEGGFADGHAVFGALGERLAEMVRTEGVTDDIVQGHHEVVYRECGGYICGEAFYRFDGLGAAQVLEYNAELRELFGERFDALDECGFAVKAELARFFSVDAKHEAEFFHHGDDGEHGFKVADTVCTVRRDACGVVLTGNDTYGHHVLQVLFRVVRVQLECHERNKVRAHGGGCIKNLLLVFCNRGCTCHGGDGVRHNDGAAELGHEIAYIAVHKFALAQVGVKIVW